MLSAAFSHGPLFAMLIEERDVQGAVIERITAASFSSESIVWRKYATDEGDYGHTVPSVCTQRINIPPSISVGRNRCIEVKSCSNASAASRPESAAIGTPGPGWVLPPAM